MSLVVAFYSAESKNLGKDGHLAYVSFEFTLFPLSFPFVSFFMSSRYTLPPPHFTHLHLLAFKSKSLAD